MLGWYLNPFDTTTRSHKGDAEGDKDAGRTRTMGKLLEKVTGGGIRRMGRKRGVMALELGVEIVLLHSVAMSLFSFIDFLGILM